MFCGCGLCVAQCAHSVCEWSVFGLALSRSWLNRSAPKWSTSSIQTPTPPSRSSTHVSSSIKYSVQVCLHRLHFICFTSIDKDIINNIHFKLYQNLAIAVDTSTVLHTMQSLNFSAAASSWRFLQHTVVNPIPVDPCMYIALCLFILSIFLWMWFLFYRLQDCSSSCFCCLPSHTNWFLTTVFYSDGYLFFSVLVNWGLRILVFWGFFLFFVFLLGPII